MIRLATAEVWMIEVLGDGTGQRHRRYLVAAHHREAAIASLRQHLASDPLVTSITQLGKEAAAICKLATGEVKAV
jgi:hypothetical protein